MNDRYCSTSSLRIEWSTPDLSVERWEFDNHPAKQAYYRRHTINWEHLEAAFPGGRLTPWPRGGVIGTIPVEGSHSSYDDYLTCLSKAKRGYRINYNRMEEELQRSGRLSLPAPIVLTCGGEGLLFAGWRRLCLAWNYGMIPHVWLVTLAESTP